MEDGTPRYYKIKQILLGELESGHFKPGDRFLTEKELRERFKVSATTAVRVLNDLEREGYLVRRQGKGTFVAERQEPKAEPAPLPQVTPNGRLIACVFSQIGGGHVVEVIRGVEAVCHRSDYHMILFDSSGSPEREAMNLRRAREAGAGGIILFPTDGEQNQGIVEEYVRRGFPVVMVDRYYPAVATDIVVPDNFGIGYRLTKHLIDRGHKHIATIWGETNCTSVRDRMAGYKEALLRHNVPIVPEISRLFCYERLRPEERYDLLRTWLNAPYRPSVFVGVNGYVATMVATDLAAIGVHVGEEVEIAGMDHVGPYTPMPIMSTNAVLPSREMGISAAEILIERLREPQEQRQFRYVVLPVEISANERSAVKIIGTAPKGM